MAELTDIKTRLMEATGADRKLDAELMCIQEGYRFDRLIGTDATFYVEGVGHPVKTSMSRVLPYTASVDAALELVERKLPDWQWEILWNNCQGYLAQLTDNARAESSGARFMEVGETPALALLAVLMKALSNGEKDV